MAHIVREIMLLLKSMIRDTNEMTMLNNRMYTLRNILEAVNQKLSTFSMHLLKEDDLYKLEVRLYQLRPVLLRLRFRKDGDDVEKLQKVAQSREEIKEYDALLGRMRLDLAFMIPDKSDLNDPLNKYMSESRRQRDVKKDAKEIIMFIRKLFPYRSDLSTLGRTPAQIQLAHEVRDCIHNNESLTWKHAIFMSKIEPKLFELAKATVDLLEESYFDQGNHDVAIGNDLGDDDVHSITGDTTNNNEVTLQNFYSNLQKREERFMQNQHAETIGTGSFGAVLSAQWNDQEVALRPIPRRAELSLIARAEIRSEALRWKEKLKHVNVLQFHGFLVQDSQWYFILEKCNTSLYEVLHGKTNRKSMEATWRDAIIRGMARGLAFLHENNTLHMCLKPDHVLIGGGDGRIAVKLSSFGLAHTRSEMQHNQALRDEIAHLDKTRSYLPYMAPELHESEENWSTRADIYSLGIILWEMTQNNKFPLSEYRNLREAVFEKRYRPRWSDDRTGADGNVARQQAKQARNQHMGTFMSRHESRHNLFSVDRLDGNDTFAFTFRDNSDDFDNDSGNDVRVAIVPKWLQGLAEKSWSAEPFKRPRAAEVIAIVEHSVAKTIDVEQSPLAGAKFKKKSTTVLATMMDAVNPEEGKRMRNKIEFSKGSPGELLDRIDQYLNQEEFVQKSLFTLVNELKTNPATKKELAEHGAVETLLEVLKLYPRNATVNANCINVLRMCLKSPDEIMAWKTLKGGSMVINAMNNHPDHALIQFFGVMILGNLAISLKGIQEEIFDAGALQTVLNAMESHPDAKLIQRYACLTIGNFLRDTTKESGISGVLYHLNMPFAVKQAMQTHRESMDVQLYAIGALLNFVNVDKSMSSVLLGVSMHKEILEAMRLYLFEEKLQDYGCAVLKYLCAEPSAMPKLLASHTIEILFEVLSAYPDSAKTKHNAWRCIHNLCMASSSLPHILKSMRNNMDKSSVQVNGCIALTYLASNLDKDEKYALVEFDALAFILETVIKMHENVQSVMVEACVALRAITVGAPANAEAMVDIHGVEAIIAIMKEYPSNKNLQQAALGVFRNLVHVGVNGPNDKTAGKPLHERNAIQKHNAATEVMVAMINHYKSIEIQSEGLYILSELATWQKNGDVALRQMRKASPENYDSELIQLGAVDVILTAMNEHHSIVTIQDLCLITLTRLAHNDINRQQLVNDGLIILAIERMEHFADYKSVLLHCAYLLDNIVVCDECSAVHAQLNQKTPKGEPHRFQWENSANSNAFVCNYQCRSRMNPRAIQLLADSMVQYPDDNVLRNASSMALYSFAVGSAEGYQWVNETLNSYPQIRLSWLRPRSSKKKEHSGQRLIGSRIQSRKPRQSRHNKSAKMKKTLSRNKSRRNNKLGKHKNSGGSSRSLRGLSSNSARSQRGLSNNSTRSLRGFSNNSAGLAAEDASHYNNLPPGLPQRTLTRTGSSKVLLVLDGANDKKHVKDSI